MLKRLQTDMLRSEQRGRDLSLDGIRGLAAIVVVLSHNTIGFFPRQSGWFDVFQDPGQRALPWFGALNGTAAVTVFFVLSGLVLSRGYFLSGDANIIARGAIKRWPRLAGPVIFVVMLSALLDHLGLYRFDQAASLTHSPWLAGHLFHGTEPAGRTFLNALAQGALTFFRGDSYYDTSLWTMRLEMTGSYMVFGLSLMIGQVQRSAVFTFYIIGIMALIDFYLDIQMLAFVAGVALAYTQSVWRFSLPLWASVALILMSFFLLGYTELDSGWYHPFYDLTQGANKLYIYTFSAAALIFAVDSSSGIKSFFQRPWSVFLGWISFPLYLIHIPVLCSIGCGTFLETLPLVGPKLASLVAMGVTIVFSVGVSIPLAMLSDIWTRKVDSATRSLCASITR